MCNRPSQIHCLNSDEPGDLSLLRYKPDFVTSLFVINELYCIFKFFFFLKIFAKVKNYVILLPLTDLFDIRILRIRRFSFVSVIFGFD